MYFHKEKNLNFILSAIPFFLSLSCKVTNKEPANLTEDIQIPEPHVFKNTDYPYDEISEETIPGSSPVNKNIDKKSFEIDGLSFKKIIALEAQTSYGFYLPNKLTTPVSKVVVTKIDNSSKKYQEALGYELLINNPKFPSITVTEDGTIVLLVSYVSDSDQKRKGYLMTSKNGLNWSTPKKTPWHRANPVAMGGSNLMMYLPNSSFVLTHNYGESWHSNIELPEVEGRKCYTDVAYDPLIEGNKLHLICWVNLLGNQENHHDRKLFTQAVFMTYTFGEHVWEIHPLPKEWGLNEGSLIRADNGNLVACFRTQLVDTPVPSDNFMGLATSISKDNGKTWSLPVQHFLYGRMHASMIKLKNGSILMTYAVRVGQLDSYPQHGVEAVLSHDNGKSWDWEHRFIIARRPSSTIHSPHSVLMSDGNILTVYMNDTYFSYKKSERLITPKSARPYTGHVSAIIWNPENFNN